MNKPPSALPDLIGSGTYEGDKDVPVHDHQGTELILVTQGWCEVMVGEEQFSTHENTLLIVPEATKHNQINHGRVETKYTVFRSGSYFTLGPRTLNLEGDPWIPLWLRQITDMGETLQADYLIPASGLMYAILQRIVQIDAQSKGRREFPAPLGLALDYIESHLNRPLSLNDIAGASNMSSRYLNLLFKKHLDLSPMNYVIRCRLTYAKRLLRDPYLQIKEISARCGFQDSNYFCRLFKKQNHCTPGQFRLIPAP